MNKKNNLIKRNVNTNNNNNSNILSFGSNLNNKNNNNYISPSIDNFSHIAIVENNSNIDNIIKINQFRDMNNDNMDILKRNLSNNNKKSNQNRNIKSNSNDIIEQMNNVLKKIQLRKENNKNVITQSNINNHLQESSLFINNVNKGYHSDGYLNEQKKLQQYNSLINSSKNKNHNYNSYKNLNSNNYICRNSQSQSQSQSNDNNYVPNNNLNLNGYEINTFYTGDTSQLDSLRGDNNITPDIKKIKGKNGKIYYSKYNKIKKINEDQTRKIEQLLGYNSSSIMSKTPMNYTNKIFNTRLNSFKKNNDIVINNYDNFFNNEAEISSINNNNSKTNLTSHTYQQNNTLFMSNNNINKNNMNNMNNINQQLFSKKNNINNKNKNIKEQFSPTINRFMKQKNILGQGKLNPKNISNNVSNNKLNNANIFNNFNGYMNNRGNITSNLYNNNFIYEDNQGIKINDNIINKNRNILNKNNNKGNPKYGPIQIQIKNGKKNNDYINQTNQMNQINQINQYQYNNNNLRNSNVEPTNYKRQNNFINNNPKKMKNNSKKHFSVDQKIRNNINYQIPNNYINTFINAGNINNYDNYANTRKRNAKSFDLNREQLNIGVYSGIHNINNNINNININNINYDSGRFNNLIGLDMGMNYNTQKNFYEPNNMLNNEIYFDEVI